MEPGLKLTNTQGMVVFVRNDSADFEEISLPFRSLGELVVICSHPAPELSLEKIVVEGTAAEGHAYSLILDLVASHHGPKRATPVS